MLGSCYCSVPCGVCASSHSLSQVNIIIRFDGGRDTLANLRHSRDGQSRGCAAAARSRLRSYNLDHLPNQYEGIEAHGSTFGIKLYRIPRILIGIEGGLHDRGQWNRIVFERAARREISVEWQGVYQWQFRLVPSVLVTRSCGIFSRKPSD